MRITSSLATHSSALGRPAAERAVDSTAGPAESFEFFEPGPGGSLGKALAFGALGAAAGAVPALGAVSNGIGGYLAVGQIMGETLGGDASTPGAVAGAIGGVVSQIVWGALADGGTPAAIAIPILYGALSWARVGYLGSRAHPDNWGK